MKILAISDTHGDISKAKKIWASVDDPDLVLHMGDHYSDALRLADSIKTPVIAVPGNMDPELDAPLNQVVETEAGSILITHGHTERVRWSFDSLIYRAEERGCAFVLFGHTHVAMDETIDGIRLINPGSLTRPRDGNSGSYALIETSPGKLTCRIIRLENDKASKKSSDKGGRLRKILNYSDRL